MNRTSLLPFWIPAVLLACGSEFYFAPPTLDQFPERLPRKTMRQILGETGPANGVDTTFEQLLELTGTIARQLTEVSPEESMRQIDEALVRNREGEYRKRFSNCLNDFRDVLISDNLPKAEVEAYCRKRITAMAWDNGLFARMPVFESDYSLNYETFKKVQAQQKADWLKQQDEYGQELAQDLEKATTGLLPHWLVLNGAWSFKQKQWTDSEKFFSRVLELDPKHPRAEVALLMLARVKIEQWNEVSDKLRFIGSFHKNAAAIAMEAQELYEQAREALARYQNTYPAGRFIHDIPGWRGGLARKQGYWSQAFEHFLEQTDFVDHPEVVRGALKQCEQCLEELEAGDAENQSLAKFSPAIPEIAKRPIAALAVIYHFLDRRGTLVKPEAFDLVNDVDVANMRPVLKLSNLGRTLIPAIARAVVADKSNYSAAVWQPRYLAILAWAASESGAHEQAVKICDLAGEKVSENDDLLFARNVALQRKGDLAGALEGFLNLRSRFPESLLKTESEFRIAALMRDLGQTGSALAEFMRFETQNEGTIGGHGAGEIHQWIDVMLHFSPLKEIERALSFSLTPAQAELIRSCLRLRYLATEDFESAKRFPLKDATESEGNYGSEFFSEFKSHEEWLAEVTKIQERTAVLEKAVQPQKRAELAFEVAELWANNRGKICLPLVRKKGEVFRLWDSWNARIRNAQVFGLSKEGAEQEIGTWDEQWHAFNYYVRAANELPASKLAATAISKANESLRKISALCPWGGAYAFEADFAKRSRALYQRLLNEHLASREFKTEAVWWSYRPPLETRWNPGTSVHWMAEPQIAAVFSPTAKVDEDGYTRRRRNEEFLARLYTLATRTREIGVEASQSELEEIRRDFIVGYDSPNDSRIMNHLDDLALFLKQPGVTPAICAKYFPVRLNERTSTLDIEKDDADLKPYQDFLSFIDAVYIKKMVSEDAEVQKSSAGSMSERMDAFLLKYPNSPKREAALARWAVSTIRESLGHMGATYRSSNIGGALTVQPKNRGQFSGAALHSVLSRYEKEYPSGRYMAEIKMWRSAVYLAEKNWEPALNGLVATIDDKLHRDLHLDASLYLANLYLSLLEVPEARRSIFVALKNNSSARNHLIDFMHSKTVGAQLGVFEDYLRYYCDQK